MNCMPCFAKRQRALPHLGGPHQCSGHLVHPSRHKTAGCCFFLFTTISFSSDVTHKVLGGETRMLNLKMVCHIA